MPKHLSDAQASALKASATTLLFQALEMTRDRPTRITDADRGSATGMVMAAVYLAAEGLWSRKIAVEALAATAAATMGTGPEVGAFVRFWQEALGVRLVIGTPEELLARKARQELIDQIAAYETPAEYDERTGDSMSGDDALATLVTMIESARRLSKHDASQTFHFRANVPGHAAPEGGQL